MEREGVGGDGYGPPLFETKRAKGRIAYKLYACTVFVGVCLIWVYRATQILRGGFEGVKRWVWMGMFWAELWFGFYWIITQSVHWNPVHRYTFKDRLSKRYEEKLPGVDIFVCTADLAIEPPSMVINTVLSAMAYDYPPEKLSVYLSDDGGSVLTFYALLEASRFAKFWIPFCKKFKVEPRSPAAYFSEASEPNDAQTDVEWVAIKRLYKEMENRIDTAVKLGRVSEDICRQHKGFSEWSSTTTSRNHQAIVEILIDGIDQKALDTEGFPLPILVYVAREKRPHHPHKFKAGAMNALIRVSSEISNGSVILNVDCDMYSSNSESVRDALCFFMDEAKGHEFGYVQFPQNFNNISKNDIYSNSMKLFSEVDFYGQDGYGGPLYIGSNCFHRRESLCGRKYSESCREEPMVGKERNVEASTCTLEKRSKDLVTCTYEDNTQWGKEVGLKYGSLVEDVLTGLSIKYKGWKSIYFNPVRMGFMGVAPMTLEQTLVQQKRWSEGDFQILLSRYCPFLYGHGRIKLGLQMGYGIYFLWAPNSLPTLYYVVISSLSLLNGISLFPSISNIWFMPFAYVIIATYLYSLGECLWLGATLKIWWNAQRMWMFRRTTSYLFAFIDSILKQLGINRSTFIITAKVADKEVVKRYEQEIMEFGSSSPMFTILATLAMLNFICLVGGVKRLLLGEGRVLDSLFLQFAICAFMVAISMPIYQAMFFRNDGGRLPTSISYTSTAIAMLAYLIPMH